jgi:hypothetical protein
MLAAAVLIVLLLVTANNKEGFLTVDPPTQVAQNQQLQFEGERRYNDLARLQNPNTVLSADQVDDAVRNLVPTPTSSTESLLTLFGMTNVSAADDGQNKAGAGVEQTGAVQNKVNFCEGITSVNCDLLKDPRLAECGFCHRDGINSKGKAHRGGMFIASRDQIRANEAAGDDGRASYAPSVGTCKPQNFTLVSDVCVARERTLACQRDGVALSTNECGQCFGSTAPGTTGLLYMGPKPTAYSATLWISHPGLHATANGVGTVININGTTYTIPTSNKPVIDPQQLTVSVTEGVPMSITVYGIPQVWCAWLTNTAGTRAISLNLGETGMTPQYGLVIAGDSNAAVVQKTAGQDPAWAAFQAQIPNTVLWYQRRDSVPAAIIRSYYANSVDGSQGSEDVSAFVKGRTSPGQDYPVNGGTYNYNFLYIALDDGSVQTFANGATVTSANYANQVTLNVTVPGTLVEPHYQEDAADCPVGPIILTEIGAALLGANSCFAADGSFNPSLSCMQNLFLSAGGTTQGTLYPQTKEAAIALAQQGSIDATLTYINNLANIALYGTDTNGGPVDFPTLKDAALKMLGVFLNNPCDGPNQQTGPHSVECLDYLWRTSGDPSNDKAITDVASLPYTYCGASGLSAPLRKDGSVNVQNVAGANAYGAIPNIRGYYQSIYNRTQNNSNIDDQVAAMRDCFNINLIPPPPATGDCPLPNPTEWQCFGPSKLAQPEVFYVWPNGGYNAAISDATGICASYGATVATTAQLATAQGQGADWCSTGWVADSQSAFYPISTTIQQGCASSPGVQSWTPANNMAGVNCFGRRPPEGSPDVLGFTPSSWFSPSSGAASPVFLGKEVAGVVQCAASGSSCMTFPTEDACNTYLTNNPSPALSGIPVNISGVDTYVRARV